jgi:hypothetical protein
MIYAKQMHHQLLLYLTSIVENEADLRNMILSIGKWKGKACNKKYFCSNSSPLVLFCNYTDDLVLLLHDYIFLLLEM